MRDLSQYAKDYTQQPFDDTHLQFRRRKLIEQIEEYKPKRIVEISCGKRPFFEDHTNFEELVIVEPTKAFFDNATAILKNYPQLESKVVLINNYFENASEELNKADIDFVIVSNVLQEIEDVSTFLTSLYNICTKGTMVHIVVPNAKSFHRLLAFEMGMINSIHQLSDRNILLQQSTVFDLDSLSAELQKIGFTIVKAGSSFIKPFTHQQMHDMLKHKIIDETTLDGLYKMEQYMPELGAEIFVNCKIQ